MESSEILASFEAGQYAHAWKSAREQWKIALCSPHALWFDLVMWLY